jgi:hypothetical protein
MLFTIKMPKLQNKERIPKATREKCQLTKSNSSELLSAETLKARQAWNDIF